MKQFKKLFAPLKTKMTIDIFLNVFLVGIIFACVALVLVIFASKLFYFEDKIALLFAVFLVFVLTSFCVFLYKLPKFTDVLKAGDMLGFKERFQSAYEVLENKVNEPRNMSEIQMLLVEDALDKARSANFIKIYKLKIYKRRIYTLLAVLALLFVVGFMPEINGVKISSIKKVHDKVDKEIISIERAAEEAKKETTEKNAKEVDAEVKKIKKKLKAAKSDAEAVTSLKEAQVSLKRLGNNEQSKNLKAIGKKLSESKYTKAFGDAIQKGDLDAIAKEKNAFAEFLKSATDEQKAEIAKKVAESVEEISKNSEAREALQQLQEMAKSENMQNFNSAMENLGEQIDALASESAELAAAIEKLNQSVSKSAINMSGKRGQSQGAKSTEKSGKSGESDKDGESGGGEGKSNKGQGSGSGNRQGNENGANGKGSGRGVGHKESENIFSRDAKFKSDEEKQLENTQTSDGKLIENEVIGMGKDGEMRPYTEILEQYKSSELNALEDSSIPQGMKDLVKEYFSTLE